MSVIRHLVAGLRRLVRKETVEHDLDREVAHYVEMTAQEHMRRGLSRAEAERMARLEVGGTEALKEDVRSGGWEVAFEAIGRDVRYGTRALVRKPVYTLVAIATLAVGIGANTTIFSVVNALLLRPPVHVRAPEQLVSVYTSDFSGPPMGASSFPDYQEFAATTEVFQQVALYRPTGVGLGDGDTMERLGLELVSANYFEMLGVQPAAGRFFSTDEGNPGAPVAVVVLGHDLWQRRFGGTPSVVGTSVRLNGHPFTIVGVAPPDFIGSLRVVASELWVPVTARALVGEDPGDLVNRGARGSFVIARLAPGVTFERAQAAMHVVARRLAAAYPEAWTDVTRSGRRITLVPEAESRVPPQVRGPVLGFMAILMGTAGLVLLICCANVASLTLARATGRAREIGVRLALGASRRRVVRQLLIENALLALAGGVVGVLGAMWATRSIMAFQPPLPVRIALDLGLDTRVLVFSLVAALSAVVMFGVAPALRASRPDVLKMLKGDAATVHAAGRRFSLQRLLVVSQIAMSLLLLVGALLFVQSLRAAASIDPGFRLDRLLIARVLPPPGTDRTADYVQVAQALQERVGAIPGVTGVTYAAATLLGIDGRSRRSVTVEGYTKRDGEDMEHYYNHVGPSYFETMEMAVVRGRGFRDTDRHGAPEVVVVNEAFARRFWPGEDPLGKRFSVRGPEGPYKEVVGVVRDGRYLSLTDESVPYLFLPLLQERASFSLHVRTSGNPRSILGAVQDAVTSSTPGWSVMNPRTMEQEVGVGLLPQRVAATVLSLFSVAALALAAIGLYGVIAYAVASRTREIGIRLALGARRADVLRLVVGEGVVYAALGVAIGLPAAWAGSRLLSGFLIGTTPQAMAVFVGAPLLLAAIALLASWLPARRAAAVDPMLAVREE